MFDSNKVNQWLNEFGAAKGKNFALNEQGCCVLETDKDIQVHCSERYVLYQYQNSKLISPLLITVISMIY